MREIEFRVKKAIKRRVFLNKLIIKLTILILSHNKLLPPIYNVIKKCALVSIHLMTAVHNINYGIIKYGTHNFAVYIKLL